MRSKVITANNLSGLPVFHGFTGRIVGDDWNQLTQLEPFSSFAKIPLVLLQQVHGNQVLVIDRKESELPPRDLRTYDACLTDRDDLVLGVRTADCVPLLLASKEPLVVAAVHAGWKGTLNGTVLQTVYALQSKYGVVPSDLQVALGPCIHACCYEVGPEVYHSFLERFGSEVAVRKNDRLFLDLLKANTNLCMELGVPKDQIESIDHCTCCESMKFYSYRREGNKAGRQLAFIGLKKQ